MYFNLFLWCICLFHGSIDAEAASDAPLGSELSLFFQAKPIYAGWLCLAPVGTDFDNPVQRSRVGDVDLLMLGFI